MDFIKRLYAFNIIKLHISSKTSLDFFSSINTLYKLTRWHKEASDTERPGKIMYFNTCWEGLRVIIKVPLKESQEKF